MLFCRVRIFIIAKKQKIFIIISAFGVSSNGRTRDFGSLYHGSNPCAPTKNQTGLVPVLFLVRDHGATPATQLLVRQQVDLISRAQSNRYGCPAGVAHLCVTPREPVRPARIVQIGYAFVRQQLKNPEIIGTFFNLEHYSPTKRHIKYRFF